MIHRLLTTLACVLAMLGAAPAQADTAAHYWPTLYAPVGDGGAVVVQVNAPPGSWEIRRMARVLDAQLHGVTIRTGGDCATADACVRVVVGTWTPEEALAISGGHWATWTGLTTYPTPGERVIYLNATNAHSAAFRRHVAAHELGHALGLAHHESTGLMSTVRERQTDTLHAREIATLATHYGAPQ